jgi:transcriptional regulator with XRE-family HTH domain
LTLWPDFEKIYPITHKNVSNMKIKITTPAELGLVIRAARRAQGLRLDDAAAFAGVGPVFAGDVEHGKETVQLGRVLKLLAQLGLEVVIDAPDAAAGELAALRARGLRERKKRRKPGAVASSEA